MLQQNIAKVIREAQKTTADGIDEQLMELLKELLKKANNKEAYDEIADQIFKLRGSVKNARSIPLPETLKLQELTTCKIT